MNTTTFSQKIYPQTEKSAKNYWKAGLYIANFVFALLLIRYGKFFSDAITVPSSILVIGVFLFAGFARLRRLADQSRLKAYIEDHEGWALILLTLLLIAGTVSYVAFQARHDARAVQNPTVQASVQRPEAGVSVERDSGKENLAEMKIPAAAEAAMASPPPVAQLETPPADSQLALPESSSAEHPHTSGRHRKAAGRRLHRRSQTRPTSPSREYSHQTTADLPAGSR
jgi:hypothetical protein